MSTTTVDIYLKNSDMLFIKLDGKEHEVQVKQCFPWSNPRQFLSIKDLDGKELYLVDNVDNLNEKSRHALTEYLRLLDFVIEIKGINDIIEDVELRQYDVQTQDGQRVFFTELDDWPQVEANGRVIIEDISGDVYQVTNPAHLDKRGQKLLSTYVS
jgi:hypothetical protein